jgi:hypothetical protein
MRSWLIANHPDASTTPYWSTGLRHDHYTLHPDGRDRVAVMGGLAFAARG